MPYDSKQEGYLTLIHGIHIINDVISYHHERKGEASSFKKLYAVTYRFAVRNKEPGDRFGKHPEQNHADTGKA